MGAKIPLKLRPRRGGLRCEFCGRPAVSTEALRVHQDSLHSQALKEKKKRLASSTLNTKVQKRTLISKKISLNAASKENAPRRAAADRGSKIVKPKSKILKFKLKMDKQVEKNGATTRKTPEPPKKPSTSIEYKCPKCVKTFMVRFIALKHIQKRHCVNSEDEEVPPDSPDLIQPVLLELCPLCKVKLPVPHDCPLQPKPPTVVWYKCSECHQKYKNTVLFTKHIEEEHENQIQRMDFSTDDEFQTWKKQMEAQTECSYVIMQKVNKKHIYYCSEFMESGIDGNPQFCPSTIITSQIKGVNVTFYPNHYGHKHKKYRVAEEHKSFTTSDSNEQKEDIKDSSDNEDLYIQFKTLMEKIVLDAAKINVSTLKVLLNKANEMNNIVSKYNEDDDISTGSIPTSLPANTITLPTSREDESDEPTSLNEPVKTRKREKITEVNGPSAKKKKGPVKRSDTFSLADDKDSDKILKELDEPNKATVSRKVLLSSPSSFNDSYKEFIDKNKTLKKPSENTETAKQHNEINKTAKQSKKKNIVKTKMGIFKPSLSPKEDRRNSISKAKDIEYEVREQENDCNILVLKI